MLILFAFVLLILAAAVGLLFAMCAELSQRVGAGGTAAAPEARYVRPLGRPNVYVRDTVAWPAPLAEVRARGDFMIIVLSTSCQTCHTIGEQLGTDGWPERTSDELALVLSTPDPYLAEEFVDKNKLQGVRRFVDTGGDWTEAELGLTMSPVGLIFRQGELMESYVFNHIETVWKTFKEATEWETLSQPNGDHSHESPVEDSSARSVQVV